MDLNQVTVPSIDVEKSMNFYKHLGLKLIVESLPNYVRFGCPKGDSTFSVVKVDSLPNVCGIQIYFECEDLDEKVEALHKAGMTFDELPEEKSWLWKEAKIKDPAGNNIVLYYAGNQRKNPS